MVWAGMIDLPFAIKPVRSAADLQAAVRLFQAYASSLGIDLAYQDFATELATLPGKYAPPAGELLLARHVSGTPLDASRSGQWRPLAAAR